MALLATAFLQIAACSISQQAWWSKTKSWLQLTYPDAQLVMEEHAHGGCAAQCLIGHEAWSIDGSQINRLPQDVFGWHPDLIIFHVTGDHVDYGYIMKAFKLGCAAFDDYRTHDGKDVDGVHCTPQQRALSRSHRAPEVLVQNDFIAADTPVACPDDPTPSVHVIRRSTHLVSKPSPCGGRASRVGAARRFAQVAAPRDHCKCSISTKVR